MKNRKVSFQLPLRWPWLFKSYSYISNICTVLQCFNLSNMNICLKESKSVTNLNHCCLASATVCVCVCSSWWMEKGGVPGNSVFSSIWCERRCWCATVPEWAWWIKRPTDRGSKWVVSLTGTSCNDWPQTERPWCSSDADKSTASKMYITCSLKVVDPWTSE